MKRTRLRYRGGSRFPKRRDPAYMEYLLEELEIGVRCDGCGGWRATVRAHLDAKGSGGYDRDNVVLLCGPELNDCHGRQEKRTDAFIEETGRDLRAAARVHSTRYALRAALPF